MFAISGFQSQTCEISYETTEERQMVIFSMRKKIFNEFSFLNCSMQYFLNKCFLLDVKATSSTIFMILNVHESDLFKVFIR